MKYAVLLQPAAEADLETAYAHAAAHAPATAIRWYNRFIGSLDTLAENPQRCGLAPEAKGGSWFRRNPATDISLAGSERVSRVVHNSW